MSNQEHFFLEYMPAVSTSPKSPVIMFGAVDELTKTVYILTFLSNLEIF